MPGMPVASEALLILHVASTTKLVVHQPSTTKTRRPLAPPHPDPIDVGAVENVQNDELSEVVGLEVLPANPGRI